MPEAFAPPLEPGRTRRNDLLKIIALASMLIDHIGAVFFPDQLLWRTVGRLAFPIFCWQLAEGYVHTSSRTRYGARIFLFGCIAQVPYMYLNPENVMTPLHINILFQLFTGVLLMGAADRVSRALAGWRQQPLVSALGTLLWGTAALGLIFAPDLANAWEPGFRFSYGTYGQLMMLMFYAFRGRGLALGIAWAALSVFHAVQVGILWQTGFLGGAEGLRELLGYWMNGSTLKDTLLWTLNSLPAFSDVYFQARSLAALPLILLLENHGGRLRLNRWVAYWFYPVHMALLVSLRWLMLRG